MKEKKIKERGSPQFRERNIKIKRMREVGYSLQQIGESFHLTKERIRQILVMEERNKKNGFR